MNIHISPAPIYISQLFATTKTLGLHFSSEDGYVTGGLGWEASAVLLGSSVPLTVSKIEFRAYAEPSLPQYSPTL